MQKYTINSFCKNVATALIGGYLFSTVAAAQDTAPQAIAPAPVVATNSKGEQMRAAVFAGPLKLTTTEDKEVDKKGNLFGVGFSYERSCEEWRYGGGLGYLVTRLSGSGEMISGDQTATLSSPYLEIKGGYQFDPLFKLDLGFQTWIGKGSDFGPEDQAKRARLFWTLGATSHPEATSPVGFSLNYVHDLSVADRDVSGFILGVDYLLSLY